MGNSILEKRLGRVRDLSTLPVVVNNVIQITQNPKSSAMEVGKAISQDQVLTSNVLKMVNSAFYGFPRKITTITHAIVVLGFANIRNLVLTTSIFNMFSSAQKEGRFDLEGFWKHSLACSVTTKIIARRLGMKNLEEVFLWGLLHDLGKLVLVKYLEKDYARVTALVHEKDILIRVAEKEILGFDHAAAGYYVGNRWNLPPGLLKAIRYHHTPAQAIESKRIVAIIHVADALCRALGLGNGGDSKIPPINTSCWELLNLGKETVKDLFAEMEKEIIAADTLLHFN